MFTAVQPGVFRHRLVTSAGQLVPELMLERELQSMSTFVNSRPCGSHVAGKGVGA